MHDFQVVALVFDLTNYESFFAIRKIWMSLAEENSLQSEKILVGNKCDLKKNRQVQEAEIMEFCHEKGMKYIECSAKKDLNTEDIFEVCLWDERGNIEE